MGTNGHFLRWFATNKGREFMGTMATTAVVGGGLSTFLPHWVFIKKYHSFKQMYRCGNPEPLADRVNKIAAEEMNKSSLLNDAQKNMVKFFTVTGFNVFHAGSIHINYGSIIGLPINFKYSEPSDVERKFIEVGEKKIHWSSESGKQLEESLILSDEAIRFAINRELYYLTRHRELDMGGTSLIMLMQYGCASNLNTKLHLFKKPCYFRFSLYGILFSIGLYTWFALKDLLNVFYDKRADEETAKLGKDYIEGGLEFYSKIMQKNDALHMLLGPNGEDLYAVKGIDNIWNRIYNFTLYFYFTYLYLNFSPENKNFPLQQRLEFLKNKLTLIEIAEEIENDNR